MEASRPPLAWAAVAAGRRGVRDRGGGRLRPGLTAPAGARAGRRARRAVRVGRRGDRVSIGSATRSPIASVVGVIAGMAGFLVLLRAAWRGEVPLRLALGLAVGFHLALLLLPLLISRDVYSYIAQGQIVSIHGANPYVQTPGDFPSLLTRELVGPAWLDTPSVYGPLFSHLAGVVTRISDRLDVLVDAFRVIAIAASLATTFVIGAVVRRHRPGPSRRSRWPRSA